MTLSCKIASTPLLIKCPQSNCVGINGVAMLILLNNSAYRQIYCSPWVVFGTDSTVQQATVLTSTEKGCFEGCVRGSRPMKRDSFVCTPGRVWLFWHKCTFTFQSGNFLVEAGAVQELQGEDGGESFINGPETEVDVLDECMWFLYPDCMCVCPPLV